MEDDDYGIAEGYELAELNARVPLQWVICDWREEGEIHIVPTDSEHGRTDCWCGPEPKPVKDKDFTIYLHFVRQ